MKKKILILGGKPIGSVEIVQRAKELGFYTIVADYLNKDTSPAKSIADESWEVSTADVDVLADLSIEHGVEGILAGVHEFNINRMLDLCEALGKPSYCNKDTWRYCDNKLDFKRLCQENEIPVARKYSINKPEEILFPVITKPIDGSGSRGFHICYNRSDLELSYNDSASFSPSRNVLIEEYIPYDAVIIHYTMHNGQCIYSGMSDKISVKFRNTGSSVMGIQTFPSKGENVYLNTLNEKVCKMFERAGFSNGPIWIEAFYDGFDRFIFNEMGYRFGGSLTYYPVNYFHGLNQLDALIMNAMGEDYEIESAEKEHPSHKYCILPIHIKAGRISEIVDVDKVKNRSDVYAYVPVHFKGDKILNWGSAQQVFCYLHILFDDMPGLKKSIQEILSDLEARNEQNENMLYTLFDVDSL